MGRSIFTVESLLPPLSSLEERYVLLPMGKSLKVDGGSSLRVMFFLEGNMELSFSTGVKVTIEKGDAVSVSLPVDRFYRSTKPTEEVRNHVIALKLTTEPGKRRRKTAGGQPLEILEDQIANQLSGFHHFPKALDRGKGWDILQEIRKETEKRQDACRWKISGLSLALISLLLDSSPEDKAGASLEKGAASVQHARQYIVENYRENLTLSRIAWEVRLSGEHLERLFRKHAGMTVFEFVGQVRIEKVKQLLLTSDLPVVAIAGRCGYSSSNLLCRHFKAKAGVTPLAYRLQGRSYERFSPSKLQAV